MSHKIPLMVAAAVAALLVLTVVQARGPNPLADVDTTIDAATEASASGTITVCNVSEDSTMTIETVAAKLFYKEGRGDWTPFADATVSGLAPGDEILAGEDCLEGSWDATYDPLEGATRIRIEAQVTVEERPDKVFIARDCADVV